MDDVYQAEVYVLLCFFFTSYLCKIAYLSVYRGASGEDT